MMRRIFAPAFADRAALYRLVVLSFMVALASPGCRHDAPIEFIGAAKPPTVQLLRPQVRKIVRVVGQPSFIESYERTSIYAKPTAYILKWIVDIVCKVIVYVIVIIMTILVQILKWVVLAVVCLFTALCSFLFLIAGIALIGVLLCLVVLAAPPFAALAASILPIAATVFVVAFALAGKPPLMAVYAATRPPYPASPNESFWSNETRCCQSGTPSRKKYSSVAYASSA